MMVSNPYMRDLHKRWQSPLTGFMSMHQVVQFRLHQIEHDMEMGFFGNTLPSSALAPLGHFLQVLAQNNETIQQDYLSIPKNAEDWETEPSNTPQPTLIPSKPSSISPSNYSMMTPVRLSSDIFERESIASDETITESTFSQRHQSFENGKRWVQARFALDQCEQFWDEQDARYETATGESTREDISRKIPLMEE